MSNGEYIVDRWIVKILRDLCEARGISFTSYSSDWLVEMKQEEQTHRVMGYRFDLNDSVAASIAQDKVATFQLLAKADIPAVPHVLVRTKASAADREVMSQWDKVVIKPLVGTSGHGVRLFTSVDYAFAHIEHSTIAAWAASPFIDIQREIRLVMLDGMPLLVYEKQPVVREGLKMFNLGLGATPKDVNVSDEMLQLAAITQRELGLRLSTVDIVEDETGKISVLEVNDSIMMEYYARFSKENLERAEMVYRKILDAVMHPTATSG